MYLYFWYLSTYNNSGFVFVSVWLNYPPLLNSMLYFTSHYLLTLLLALKILKIFIKIFISLFKNIFTQGLFSKFPRMTRPFFHKSFLPQGLISTRSFFHKAFFPGFMFSISALAFYTIQLPLNIKFYFICSFIHLLNVFQPYVISVLHKGLVQTL